MCRRCSVRRDIGADAPVCVAHRPELAGRFGGDRRALCCVLAAALVAQRARMSLGGCGPGNRLARTSWCCGSVRSYSHGGLASTGKAVDLKSTGPRGPWGFESLALRQLIRALFFSKQSADCPLTVPLEPEAMAWPRPLVGTVKRRRDSGMPRACWRSSAAGFDDYNTQVAHSALGLQSRWRTG